MIEHHWREKILPLLYEEVVAGAELLLHWAVTKTGHDNTTFIILKYQAAACAANADRATTDLAYL